MNTQVTATNMQVRAVAEKGLLINEVQAADSQTWDDVATAAQDSTKLSMLYPASTANGTNWYHGASKKSNTAAKATDANAKSGDLINDSYEALPAEASLSVIASQSETTAEGNTQAVYKTMGKATDAEAGYYVHYIYYLKSAGAGITLNNGTGVVIKSVSANATPDANNTDPANSTNLDKAIRVGIKLATAFYIYAPLSGYTESYFVNAGTENNTATGTPVTARAANYTTVTDLAALPAANEAGAKVDVYIWYEGEDQNCTSDNARAATLDDISVEIVFALDSTNAVKGAISGTAKSATLSGNPITLYQVGTTEYYADTTEYVAGKTKFYTVDTNDVATLVNNVVYSVS